jgi:octaprenyl-diphosphate synthase
LHPRKIFKLVEDDLVLVEQELARHSASNIHLIDCIGEYVHDSGGKRIRPALLLLAAQACGYRGEIANRLGAVVELIHSATLVHDDIIDDAKVRRGRPSVNAKWGNEITVLMGDWLYMTSFNLALAERQFEILDILIDVTRKMVEGELIQLSMNGKLDVTEEQHLDIIRRKTAYLFSACSQIGGILGKVDPQMQQQLRFYGLNLGIAFQMVDDLLDFTSSESTLGKPVGSDISGGKLTLPLIYLIQCGEKYRQLVAQVFEQDGSATAIREEILDLLRKHKTLDLVREKSRAYAASAKKNVEGLPPSPARDALLSIPDFVVDRDR